MHRHFSISLTLAIRLAMTLLLFTIYPNAAWANDPTGNRALVKHMQSGDVVLMVRHALAPGIGDPANFRLDDCNTQRNLSEAGREQARAMGKWLRSQGIEQVKLYSSQWCRCLDTARLMQLGPVMPLPALNSFFRRPEEREPSLSALRKFIAEKPEPGELIIMVTHQVTISGITGRWTDSGQGQLLQPTKDGGIEWLGEVGF